MLESQSLCQTFRRFSIMGVASLVLSKFRRCQLKNHPVGLTSSFPSIHHSMIKAHGVKKNTRGSLREMQRCCGLHWRSPSGCCAPRWLLHSGCCAATNVRGGGLLRLGGEGSYFACALSSVAPFSIIWAGVMRTFKSFCDQFLFQFTMMKLLVIIVQADTI